MAGKANNFAYKPKIWIVFLLLVLFAHADYVQQDMDIAKKFMDRTGVLHRKLNLRNSTSKDAPRQT